MKNLIKFSLSTLMVSMLVACAGSDSSSETKTTTETETPVPSVVNSNEKGNDTSSSSNPTPTPQTDTNTTTITPSPKKESLNSVYGGTYWSTVGESDPERLDETSTETLIINGETIDVYRMPLNKETSMPFSRFGWYTNPKYKDGTDDSTFVYSIGMMTELKEMPTSGTVEYKGTAYYGTEELGFIPAQSEFNVDFGAKTVNGKIYNKRYSVNETLPQATISGNRFEGESEQDNNIKGSFFGSDAQELGGIWEEGITGKAAVFGAKKQ